MTTETAPQMMPHDRQKLSVCIITKNEAHNIVRCLRAVRELADDIVVIDSGSTDDTTALAEAEGARVLFNPWTGYGPQKRFSEEQAAFDWILNLDADEVVTPELVAEIRALLQAPPPLSGYRVRICNVYPGEAKPRLWADYHNYVRLYDRRKMRFRESPVHDTVDTLDQPVGQLAGTVTHFSARSFEHIRQKLDSYSDLQAKTLKKGKLGLALRLPFEYPSVFIRFYLLRRHFTGGWNGVRTAHIAAEARFKRLLKMWAPHDRTPA